MHLQEKLEMAVRKNEDHKRLFAALKRYQSDDYQVLADWYEERGFVNRAARQRLVASRIDYLRNVLFADMKAYASDLYDGHTSFRYVEPGIQISIFSAAYVGFYSSYTLRWENRYRYDHCYYGPSTTPELFRVPRLGPSYTRWIQRSLAAWDALATLGETREIRERWYRIWQTLAQHEQYQLHVWGHQYKRVNWVVKPDNFQNLTRRDCLDLTEVVRQMRDEGKTIDMVELP